jgi:hypothetical protein
LSFADYYQQLKTLCEIKGVSLRQTPAFDEYIRYVLLADGIHVDTLFKEISELENKVLADLITNAEQKKIAAASQFLMLANKLVKFELTPREWENYKSMVDSRFPIDHRLNLSSFERFYEHADIRSEKMVENLKKFQIANDKAQNNIPPYREAMGRLGGAPPYLPTGRRGEELIQAPASVLVVGGFHTPHITALLKKQNTPYIVVSPKITKIDTDAGSSYLTVFEREKTPLDKLMAQEKLFINPTNQTPQRGNGLTPMIMGALLLGGAMAAGMVGIEPGVFQLGAFNGVELFAAAAVVPGLTKVATFPTRNGQEGLVLQKDEPASIEPPAASAFSRRQFLRLAAIALPFFRFGAASAQTTILNLGNPTGYDPTFKVRWLDINPARDISAYDTLVFNARGRGNLLVRIVDTSMANDQKGALLSEPFLLSNTNQEIRIDLKRFEALGANLKSIKQITFHFGAMVWDQNTGNLSDANAVITNVSLQTGEIVSQEKPAYDGRDTIFVDINQHGRHYFGRSKIQTDQEESGDLVNNNNTEVVTGQYWFHKFGQADVFGDSILRIDHAASGKTHLYMVDATRTRFVYFTSLDTLHPDISAIDTADPRWHALGQFFSFPRPVSSLRDGNLLSDFVQQLTGSRDAMGYIYRSTLASPTQVNQYRSGALTRPVADKPIGLTMNGAGRKDVKVLHPNEVPLQSKPVTIQGRKLLVGNEPYLIHGVTLSAGHPNHVREQVQFTLGYIGGETVVSDMAKAGINTVRTYYPPQADLLDAFARHGIRVIVQFSNFDDRWGSQPIRNMIFKVVVT